MVGGRMVVRSGLECCVVVCVAEQWWCVERESGVCGREQGTAWWKVQEHVQAEFIIPCPTITS